MKILMMILMVVLSGCENQGVINKESVYKVPQDNVYIISGQSNAKRCDWSHFESITGSEVIDISHGGHYIDGLINLYDSESVIGTNPSGIIFVHGEADSLARTDTDLYNEQVERLRKLISNDVDFDLPLYISTVGYDKNYPNDDESYDILRAAVIEESKVNPLWFIGYDDAKNFRDWNMLKDNVHFTKEGCKLMMEGIAASI